MWSGRASIVGIDLAKGCENARDRIGGSQWNQGDAGKSGTAILRDLSY